MNKDDYISYLYREYNTVCAPREIFTLLNNIENNLTDELYTFIMESNINIDLQTLNIFCQTNILVQFFNKNIKKTYYKDYLNLIKKLKSTANRIQYYSETQIEIKLPKYTFDKNTIVYIFINYLNKNIADKNLIECIKKFYNIKKIRPPITDIELEIDSYLKDDKYTPDIKLSHQNLLKNYFPFSSFSNVEQDTSKYDAFIKSIDTKFNNYRKKFHSIKFNETKNTHWAIKYCNSKYQREDVHYWDINTNIKLLEDIKKYITYDIYMHLKDYNIINQIDIFTLARYITAVHIFKLTKYENQTTGDEAFYNLNYMDNTKFRMQLKTLKKDADTIYCYSKSIIIISLPIPENENIYSMIVHLQERGVSFDIISYLLEIFHKNKHKYPTSKYIQKKENILNLVQTNLMEQYNSDKNIHSIDKKVFNLLEDYDMHHTSLNCRESKVRLHETYTTEILKLFHYINIANMDKKKK